MVSEFHVVVWRWRGGRCQFEVSILERIHQQIARATGKRFQNAAFIENNPAKAIRIKFWQPLIVCHHDAGADIILFADLPRLDPKLDALADHLPCDRQRRQNENRLSCFL